MSSAVRTATNWVFRDRKTGRIVIAQRPNVALVVALVSFGGRRLFDPPSPWGTALSIVGSVALVVWAGDELVRGVNPWRRALGAGVLVAIAVGWALG